MLGRRPRHSMQSCDLTYSGLRLREPLIALGSHHGDFNYYSEQIEFLGGEEK